MHAHTRPAHLRVPRGLDTGSQALRKPLLVCVAYDTRKMGLRSVYTHITTQQIRAQLSGFDDNHFSISQGFCGSGIQGRFNWRGAGGVSPPGGARQWGTLSSMRLAGAGWGLLPARQPRGSQGGCRLPGRISSQQARAVSPLPSLCWKSQSVTLAIPYWL